MDGQIFHDPTGKRRSWVGRILAAWILLSIVCFLIFAVTLIFTPNLPGLKAQFRSLRGIMMPNLSRFQRAHELDKIRPQLAASKRKALDKNPEDTVALAFLPPWEPTALDSFKYAQSHLTHVVPSWLRLSADGAGLELKDFDLATNPNNSEIIRVARLSKTKIMPLLSNAQEQGDTVSFDPVRVNLMLSSPVKRSNLIARIVSFLLKNRFDGINLDFEDLDSKAEQNLPAFIATLGAELRRNKLELSMDVQTSANELDVSKCAAACDFLVLMAYDYSNEDGADGPIAPLQWSVDQVDKFLKRAPANKVVLGVGSYAYDWKIGTKGAASLSFGEAIEEAKGYVNAKPEDAIDFDVDSLNMHFKYADDDDKSHEVWILDGVSAYNQWQSVRSKNLRGLGLWALGSEDPSIWTFFDYRLLKKPALPESLKPIDFPRSIDFVGKGELLSVSERPQSGTRAVEIDSASQLITDQRFTEYPFSYIINKTGYQPKKLVLTFDDGPDPRYTPQILDRLKELGVPGTFFVVGQNCERYPDLVQRIYREGHELGNHSYSHPDLGPLGQQQADIEINATQRVIESLTGHRTILFRPPYNADSQPETANQVLPVDWASSLGYIVVGENIDPHDWNPQIVVGNNPPRLHTAEDISSEIIAQVEESQKGDQEGNIILLHDAGGNREQTVKAMGLFVPQLKAKGYEFVSVAQLAGKRAYQIMPSIEASERTAVGFDAIIFWSFFTFQWLLAFLFIVAIVLGFSRMFFLMPLALYHNRHRQKLGTATSGASVTVLIAAYNEEKTIAATIRSIMNTTYPLTEIVVVDDGSKDGTHEVIQRLAIEFPLLVPIRKENGGKASALNVGIAQAKGELLFCIDADTQLEPSAIGRLVPYFADEKIGAVAGNVEVGNSDNILTNWQAIEYTTSQNLDRQAYSTLNAITVVPGAIGMWRKSAIIEAGLYQTDTLAEDMDLTWRIRRLGYRIDTEAGAVAYTEAPDALVPLFKQRFRWAFGTLQCLWKHRSALGRYGWFGRLALPTLWLFQVGFQVLAPIMDLKILFAVISTVIIYFSPVAGFDPGAIRDKGFEGPPPRITDAIMPILILYGLFLFVELLGGWIAYRMEHKSAWKLWWLIPQRFMYRQLMYAVIIRGLWRAMLGEKQGWGSLKRTGTVKMK
jgi:cellulose synthase/poly-beta-1,6-N-acetylglucosamine synthase-like glycosyltransferase/peptidoglycan/xylan/chitin deacetylase (PgdA/CDA1 family)/spore germination protein YaaH